MSSSTTFVISSHYALAMSKLFGFVIFVNLIVNSQQKFEKLSIGVLSRSESCSEKSKSGDKLTVHYKGMLTDGSVFDTSYKRNSPVDFEIGQGNVIQGWERGLLK
ncbi:hypothetical protein MXB_4058 [Myxobolus squamalis]|nr:hypothetical protein MXB_4058 [Myxobolus squamalis]